ncbi:hypothetical protein [Chamaesiphon sp.]|uniref:hypothetical protein n=1 Tax=Chamaesiphon sp. TaxID=2814140 RepID=UPI003594162A
MFKSARIVSSVLLSIAGSIACATGVGAETLLTKSFKVKIIRHCEEGNVSCDRVTYIGRSLKTGKSITLTGKTVNNSGSYTFLGYEFRNEPYRYSVTRNNVLLVYKGDRLILREQGALVDN